MKKQRQLAAAAAAVLVLSGCTEIRPDTKSVSAEADLPEDKYIALTFDDGPRRETTEQLLDLLAEKGVPATFFLVGEQLAGQEDLVRRMAEEGHQVGNHTWSHARLTQLSGEERRQEIARTDQALRRILGDGDYWLRPPYGFLEDGSGIEVPLVRWSIDPRDWECRDADMVTERVLSHAEPGSIILLHDLYKSSLEAAERIVDGLQKEGYTFLTVRDLLRSAGIRPEAGKFYGRA